MRVRNAMPLTALILLLGCPMVPSYTSPSPDSCAPTQAGQIATLEVGPGDFTTTQAFVAWQNDDPVHQVSGGQGSMMMGVRLRVTGPGGLPACLPQVTRLLGPDGAELQKLTTSLKTYAAPDGSRVTRTLWVAAYLPNRFRVEVQAGGLTASRDLRQSWEPALGDAAEQDADGAAETAP